MREYGKISQPGKILKVNMSELIEKILNLAENWAVI
jgi:hypothetical protein